MLIERPPLLFRMFFRGCLFRREESGRKIVYLTFDDGPVPGVTPDVLSILERHGVKATFFMVGDNVRKHPVEYGQVVAAGHKIGNHTMHHLQGIRCGFDKYMDDVREAERYISSRLFRPPHGVLSKSQRNALEERGYRLVMYDLVTRDYSRRLTARDVVKNVKRYVRNGSVIVFHDSEKSAPRVREALEESLEWLKAEGYEFGLID